VLAFGNTDFRQDLEGIYVPTLVIHGDADDIVPIEASSDRTVKMIPNATYKKYEGAPHGLFYTHRTQLNQDLIDFCKADVGTAANATTAQRRVSM
jgi:pimeloyl-ACP methyl ester carboxylesterase